MQVNHRLPKKISARGQRCDRAGFTLVEIAVVLLVIGILISFFVSPIVGLLNQRRTEETKTKLAALESALAVYAAQRYRLPCPAPGTEDAFSASATAGLEQVDNAVTPTVCSPATQASGVVPWKTLGLSLGDVTDAWGNLFTYRVEPSLILNNSMNFTGCAPGGTAAASGAAPNLTCLAGCTTATFPLGCTPPSAVLKGDVTPRGVGVQDTSAVIVANPALAISTGAAYVVISHGENGNGAYSPSGVLQAGGSPALGTLEAKNAANLAVPITAASANYLVDGPQAFADGTSHFDDLVLRKSIMSVASKAGLGPRAY